MCRCIPTLFDDFVAQGESEIWNIQISDQVAAPAIRRTINAGTAICEDFDQARLGGRIRSWA